MAISNNNTHIFADLDRLNELQFGNACIHHQAALDLAINPEVTEIVNSQFFANTVRADTHLQIQDGDHLTLHIDANRLGVSNQRTGTAKFFEIKDDLQASALQKANDIWQQHLAQCQHHGGPTSMTSTVAPLPENETLRAQTERIEALQKQLTQMV
nr:hypothetical protein [Chlamydiota bacterium]